MLRRFICVIMTSLVIKGMDDLLDGDEMVLPWLRYSPYSLLLFALAAAFYPPWAITFFLASYGVGMIRDPFQRLPLTFTALEETIAVLLSGFLFFGWKEMLTSLLLILCIQMVDDLIDQQKDLREGRWNMATRYGWVEISAFAAAIGLIVTSITPEKTMCAALGALFIWGCEAYVL
jgi:hypothetical protein